MMQDGTNVVIADNTGAKQGRIFKVLGGSKRRYARLGDIVIISVKVAEPRKAVKKKEICKAVVVRSRGPFRRKDGSYIRCGNFRKELGRSKGWAYFRADSTRNPGARLSKNCLIGA